MFVPGVIGRAVIGALMSLLNKKGEGRGRGGARSQGRQTRGARGHEERSQKQGVGGCASPPAGAVWSLYGWARGLCEPVFTDKRSAAEQERVMMQHRADGPSCAQLSLLAFHRYGDDLAFFEGRWGELTLEQCGALFSRYVRCFKQRRLTVHLLNQDGSLSTQVTYGRGDERRHVLIVPNGVGGSHCLPLGRPDFGARIEVPAGVSPLDFGTSPDPVPAEQPAEAVSAGCAKLGNAAAVSSSAAACQDAPAADAGARHDAAGELQSATPTPAPPGPAMGTAFPREEDFDSDEAFGAAVEAYAKEAKRITVVNYCGIQPPPQVPKTRYRWLGGGFASQTEGFISLLWWLLTWFTWPGLCSATMDMFSKYGCGPRYAEVRFTGGLQRLTRRVVTDGVEQTEFFTAGDTIRAGSLVWCVRQDGPGYLRVYPVDFRTWFWSSLGWIGSAGVQAPAEILDRKTLSKALWQAERLSAKDGLQTALITRMATDAAQQQWDGADAESAAAMVRMISQHYGPISGVSGPYAWGYCFSCGSPLSGKKMKQRICCKGQNTQLANAVREGCKVTSPACPVAYPGVVWTRSRHPGLKPGVETVATDANFRIPH